MDSCLGLEWLANFPQARFWITSGWPTVQELSKTTRFEIVLNPAHLRRPPKCATLRMPRRQFTGLGTWSESSRTDRQSNGRGRDIHAKNCSFLSAGRSRGFED